MKRFVLISPKNRTVYNFRGDLIKAVQAKGYEVIVTGPNEIDLDRIRNLGVRFEKIELDKTGISLIADLRYLASLFRLFKREQPDITLGYTIKPAIYGAIAARLAGVHNICSMVTGIGYVFTANTAKAKMLRLIANVLYRFGLGCAGTVIFQNTDDMNEFLKRKLINVEKCRLVNGSGVNMSRFLPADYPERLTFFMLARMLTSKGIREYLQAAKSIKAQYPDVRFMLLGAIEPMPDALTLEDLRPYIDSGIIDYHGETPDVAAFYRQCSVYVLPSYREGTPRTVLEAMAMARPIITTDAPGCRETVIDGQNGFLTPVRDAAALAAKMAWFIEHPEAVPMMGRASAELCRVKFDVQHVNEAMLRHLQIA